MLRHTILLLGLLLTLAAPVVAEDAAAPAAPKDTVAAPSAAAPEKGDEAEQIVVTATRLETPKREVASSITVITAEEMARKQQTSVIEVLRQVPSLSVAQAGGPGQVATVFIRGANSDHTKVIIDGIWVNDPISPSGGFDFGQLSTDDIERIEIIRGPQSVLYGSDAIGGVVNIITKRGKGDPHGYVKFEGGSFKTFRENVCVSGAIKQFDYFMDVGRMDTGGISSAGKQYGNHENDPFGVTNFAGKFGWRPCEAFESTIVFKTFNAAAQIDNHGGAGGDDPNRIVRNREVLFRNENRLLLADGKWEQKFGFSYVTNLRSDNDNPNPGNAQFLRSNYTGSRTKFDWQHNLFLDKTNTLTLGAETEEQSGSSEFREIAPFAFTSLFPRETQRNTGYYIQDKINVNDAFFATVGARLDDNDMFGDKATWRVAPAYYIKETDTKIKGALGTGFKAPTLYQLFSSFGNPALQPETSLGWEAGVEQRFFDKTLTAEAVYFSNRFQNLIDYSFATNKYLNVGEATSKGVELSLTYRPSKEIQFGGNYTYTQATDETTGLALLRRPRNKGGVDVTYFATDKLTFTLAAIFVGQRRDVDANLWPAPRVTLDSYQVWNFTAAYQLTEKLSIFGRIENAFNATYEEIKGYGVSGAAVYAGIKADF
jgi:vitamin B12 transporter